MTALLAPFSGYVPTAEFASRVVGPPRSMLTLEQQAQGAAEPLSFRHSVGRGASANHTQAMAWMQRCLDAGALHEVGDVVIVHTMERGDFLATGLLADLSITAYDTGLVKRHETTIAKTEKKMVEYMGSTRLYGNPVVLGHADDADVASLLATHVQRPADIEFVARDGSGHSLRIVEGDAALELCSHFHDALYITDGHHRLAAASTLAAAESRADPHMPCGLYAESELVLWAYSRALADPNVDVEQVRAALDATFDLTPVDDPVPRPTAPRSFGARLDGRSYLFSIPDDRVPDDPYDRLDVNLLQEQVLEPMLGVTNPRTDRRLSFIADTGDDAHDPDAYAAWFLPYPTAVRDVMTVADLGRAMPPKSTYFRPKLPAGLVVRPLDQG